MTKTIAACLALCIATAASAQAPGPSAPGEALGRCMVLKSTGADRLAVARWFLGVVASTPQAGDVTVLQPGKKDTLDRGMAQLFTRLMVTDCAAETRAVFATRDGAGTGFRVAGEALGRVAMEELLNNAQAQAAMNAYLKHINPKDFEAVVPKP